MNGNYVNKTLLYEILKRIKIIFRNYGWVMAYWIKSLSCSHKNPEIQN